MSLKLFRSTRWSNNSTFDAPGPNGRARGLNPLWIALLTSLWLASVGNLALWQELARLPGHEGWRGVLFGIGFGLIIASAQMLLLSLLAWGRLVKVAATVLLLMAGFGMHFMLLYRVVIDSTMIVNVLHTDARETRDLLNLRLALTVALVSVLPAVLVWRTRLRPVGLLGQLWRNAAAVVLSLAVLAAALLASFQDFSSTMRNHKHVRYLINPLNSVYALLDVGFDMGSARRRPFLALGEDARLGPSHAAGAGAAASAPARTPLVVLVVGETARAANFSLNGYGRMTNPRLAQENVTSFRNVRSCGTSTAASLPCMFSHLGREGYEARKADHENLLDVLQRAGLAVLWIDNQSGCKGLCARVPNVTTTTLDKPPHCRNGECLDLVMLDGLDERIAALDPARRARGVVVVLHQMGSHGPAYYKRSPDDLKPFQPECRTNVLQQCERQQLVNAYDNSIVYTDRLLAETIGWLRRHRERADTALFYVSDHGESLGENNLYLHGLPYAIAPEFQKHVPLITWLSEDYERRSGIRSACLQGRRDVALSHDHLFHSMLGLLDVQTSAYRRELDLFAPCVQR